MEHFDSLYWKRAGSGLSLGIDFKSIQEEGRVVEGFATLDNIDFADDIVPLEASIKAFENFRGNIRAQHDKNQPVGRLLGFEVGQYTDPKTGQTHDGIKVAVYVSKGAENVWEMCKDGTLSAFSIGASVKDAQRVYREDLQKTVQVINEYVLLELSLVDNPMNQLANTTAVYKAFGVDAEIEKGFEGTYLMWCAIDRISTKSASPSMACPVCKDQMGNLGRIEEDADIKEQLNKVFDISEKGGHPEVAEEIVNEKLNEEEVSEVETDAVEGNEAVEVNLEEDSVEAPAEEAEVEEESVAEVDTEIEDTSSTDENASAPALDDAKVQEFLDQLRDAFLAELASAHKSYEDKTAEVLKSVEVLKDEILKEFRGVKEEVDQKIASLDTEVNEAKGRLDVVAGELEEVASEPVVKKSLDSVHSRSEGKTNEADLFKGFFSKDFSNWDA